MKYTRVIAIFVAVGLASIPLAGRAADVQAQRLSIIEERCTTLQTTLDQIQRRDLVARTNRGREYENVNRQIDALSERLRHNNVSVAEIAASEAAYKTAVTAFREAYVRYDDSMTVLIKTNCNTAAGDFDKNLQISRVLRATVAAEVVKIENALLQFRQGLVTLQARVPAPLDGEGE